MRVAVIGEDREMVRAPVVGLERADPAIDLDERRDRRGEAAEVRDDVDVEQIGHDVRLRLPRAAMVSNIWSSDPRRCTPRTCRARCALTIGSALGRS
jgi:hypothetical protein